MKNRITNLQALLKDKKLDGLFVSSQPNVSYLTGFAGLAPHEREGFLFVTPSSATLLTFPTYYELFKNGGDNFVTKNITADHHIHNHLEDVIKREALKTVGIEETNLTVYELGSLVKKLSTNFSNTVGLIEMLRMIKDREEIEAISKAANLTDKTFDFIQTKIKKGVSEKELAFEIEFFIKRNGADLAFDPIVAIDEDAAIPHHMSNPTKKITGNNLLLLDFGAKVNNYCSDMTRVVFVGTPDEKKKKVYDTVLSSQTAALNALKAGANGMEIDKIARDVIEKEGFESYSHGLGHGVGLEIHEAPRLRAKSAEILAENSVVTVEPGIYIPGFCGVRIEDLVVLKETRAEILSKSSKEIIIL